jgi:hypothetical protein
MLGKHNPGKNPELLKSSRLLSFSKVPGFFRDCVCHAFPEKTRNFASIIQQVGVIFQVCSLASSQIVNWLAWHQWRTSVRLLSWSKVPGFFRDCVCHAFPEKTRNFASIIQQVVLYVTNRISDKNPELPTSLATRRMSHITPLVE